MFHFKYKTAMKRLLFTFLALCLAVAGSAQSGQMTSKLPTIDITKEYPKKKLVLQDIATAEYIPLETSDKVLLDGVATLHCSFTEHYITTYNANEGQIFVFDRKGKICHTFNHKGGSGEEYNYPLQLRLDEKAKELFLLDISNKIQVYSIEENTSVLCLSPKMYGLKLCTIVMSNICWVTIVICWIEKINSPIVVPIY